MSDPRDQLRPVEARSDVKNEEACQSCKAPLIPELKLCTRCFTPTRRQSDERKSSEERKNDKLEQMCKATEAELVHNISQLLLQHANMNVGKLGGLLHKFMKDHTVNAMIKLRYGGLKKFLQRHPNTFSVGNKHKYNPTVRLILHPGPGQSSLVYIQGPSAAMPAVMAVPVDFPTQYYYSGFPSP